jgi:NADH:ubiquinone reductase (H+-translocating)
MAGKGIGARRHRVVIIGSGFGGLFAAKELKDADADVTLISRTTHHLFQPLLYQVATGILSEGEVAPATREILRKQKNLDILLGDVYEIDVEARTVTSRALGNTTVTAYDSLIVAAGASTSYFGNDRYALDAPGLKSVDDALELRGRIFGAFEMANLATDPVEIQRLMTFVVVGAGPTGVEMAGQIAELARTTLRRDFRRIDTTQARVLLLDGQSGVLTSFGPKVSAASAAQLDRLGIDVWLNTLVTSVDERGLDVKDTSGQVTRIDANVVVWAAGVRASSLAGKIAAQAGVQVDRAGRIPVQPDVTVAGHPEIFVVGDMMSLDKLPGVSQVAMQQGRYAARTIKRRLTGREPLPPFHYRDKGSMATISRFSAVGDIGPLQFGGLRFAGFVAWLLWLGVHIFYLVGFKNRVTTLMHWVVTFLGRGRGQRTVTHQQAVGREALHHLEIPYLGVPQRRAPEPSNAP